MKKLLIAAALTASVCSFGVTNINAEKFDAAAVGTKPADIKEAAGEEFVNYFKADGGDASAVAAYGGDNPTASETTTAAGDAGANYLNLSTEGSTLWRTINPYKVTISEDYTTTNETTTTKAVVATGTYIDTLVQFTATEDDTNIDVDDAKLAMWLLKSGEGEDATYTLKVRGFKVTGYTDAFVGADNDDDGGFNFTLDATNIEPSTWYRLTVKAIEICTDAEDGFGYTKVGFAIYIDGNLVKPVETAFADEAVEVFNDEGWFASEEVAQAIAANELIPSLTLTGEEADDLYGVGFKGTGAIDSIAWTDDDDLENTFVSAGFTLTIAMNNVTAAEYTIGEDTVDVVGGKITGIAADTTVVIKATGVTEGYLAPAPVTVEVKENATIDLTAVAFDKVELAEDSNITSDNRNTILAWAAGVGNTVADVQAATTLYNNYLLNVANLAVDPQIKIVSIDVTKSPIEVVAEVTDANGTFVKNLENLNATVKYKAAATLAGLDGATATTDKPAKADGSQFIKVIVE